MTLFDRETFNFYMEGAKRIHAYRAMPMDVTTIADGLKNIYTYIHCTVDVTSQDRLYFAIGKVEET